MNWAVAPCISVLRSQADKRWPNRDRTSDGTIGDVTHQGEGAPQYNVAGYATSGSDHNPDANGFVCAIDIDHDIDDANGYTSKEFAIDLALTKDPRIGYIISFGKIWSNQEGTGTWAWRPYGGKDPHENHCHLSVRHTPQWRDSTGLWMIGSPIPKKRGLSTMYMIKDKQTGGISSTDWQTRRALGGQQSAAASKSKSDTGEVPIISEVEHSVYCAIPVWVQHSDGSWELTTEKV